MSQSKFATLWMTRAKPVHISWPGHVAWILASALLLAACETTELSKKECLGADGVGADWASIGFEDGLQGELETRVHGHAARCAEFGAGVDVAAYTAGRADGIAALCNEQNGFDFAYRGDIYRGVCRAEKEAAFLTGYVGGRRVFFVKQGRDAASADYNAAVTSVDYHRNQIQQARRRINAADISEKDLKRARRNLRYSRDQLPFAERDVEAKAYELGRADEALESALAGIEDYKRTDAFAEVFERLYEAHAFARAQAGVSHCEDGDAPTAPQCVLALGGFVRPNVDQDGRPIDASDRASICVSGPGELVYFRRDVLRRDGPDTAMTVGYFDFYPLDPARNQPARDPAQQFNVTFNWNEGAVTPIAGLCRASF